MKVWKDEMWLDDLKFAMYMYDMGGGRSTVELLLDEGCDGHQRILIVDQSRLEELRDMVLRSLAHLKSLEDDKIDPCGPT